MSNISKCEMSKYDVLSMIIDTLPLKILEYKQWLIKSIMKIRDPDNFYSILVLLNKNTYFGYYNILFSYNLENALLEENTGDCVLILTNLIFPETIENEKLERDKREEFKKLFDLEKLAMNYFLEKVVYGYEITFENLNRLRCELGIKIDFIKNITIKDKTYDIIEVLRHSNKGFFKNIKTEILEDMKTELQIVEKFCDVINM